MTSGKDKILTKASQDFQYVLILASSTLAIAARTVGGCGHYDTNRLCVHDYKKSHFQ